MNASRHDDMVSLLGPAALGLVTTAERQQLDGHLTTCPACRVELASLTGVAGRLGDLGDVEALEVPDTDRARSILAAVAQERWRDRRRMRRLQTVLATAASVVVLTAGVVAAGALAESQDVVRLEAVAVSSPEDVEARAELIAHTWGVEIQLVAQGLVDGEPYTVQVRTSDGTTVEAGAFLGTGGRSLRCNLNASVLRPDADSFVVLDAAGAQVLSAQL